MTKKNFNKAEFEREMKNKYSREDIMIRGKRVDFETPINGQPLSKLIYGDIPKEDLYESVWENFRRYN